MKLTVKNRMSCKRISVAALLPFGLVASSGLAGDSKDHQRDGFAQSRHGDVYYVTNETASEFRNILAKESATIKDAISKAESKCQGTAISAKCRMVRPSTLAHQLEGDAREEFTGDQEQLIIEVCCIKKDSPSTVKKVVYCPESEKVALVKDQYVSLRRHGDQLPQTKVNLEHIEKADPKYDGRAGDRERTGERDYTRRAWTRFSSPAKSISKGQEIIGATVKSTKGESLGEIQDLAIDPESGRISYAVLSFGGFLGVGDKYFAIPWNSLARNTDDKNAFILDVTQEQLEKAPGFRKDNWPDMANQNWGKQIHAYYGERPYWESTNDPYSVEGFDEGAWAMTTYKFTDSNQDERDNQLPDGRAVVSVIERQDFDLQKCVDKANSYTNGEAVLAEFVMVPGDRFNAASKSGQKPGEYESSARDGKRLVANVACVTKKGAKQLKLVSICPASKEVLRVKDVESLSASADSGTRTRLAGIPE